MRYIISKQLLMSIVMISMSLFSTLNVFSQDNKQYDTQHNNSGVKTIYVSIPPLAHFVEQITTSNTGADTYKVVSLVSEGHNAERYIPTPKQLKALVSADIFFGIGLSYEKNIVASIKKKSDTLKIYELGTALERIYDDDHDEEIETEDYINGNPHIWMNFNNATHIIYEIYEILSSVYPTESTMLKNNHDAFHKKIVAIQQDVQHTFSSYQGRSFMIYHPVLSYYAKEFGINQISIQTENTGEASIKRVKTLYDDAISHNVTLLLLQKGYASKDAITFSKKIHAETAYITPLEKDWEHNMLFITDTIIQSFNK